MNLNLPKYCLEHYLITWLNTIEPKNQAQAIFPFFFVAIHSSQLERKSKLSNFDNEPTLWNGFKIWSNERHRWQSYLSAVRPTEAHMRSQLIGQPMSFSSDYLFGIQKTTVNLKYVLDARASKLDAKNLVQGFFLHSKNWHILEWIWLHSTIGVHM